MEVVGMGVKVEVMGVEVVGSGLASADSVCGRQHADAGGADGCGRRRWARARSCVQVQERGIERRRWDSPLVRLSPGPARCARMRKRA
ncbi:hypothetical protein GCM10022419_022500 [Nonomuraea rosea]|uniref:Uncharacterized protein n=1 Tax=Nonomuraea rosea TaxID=638574 RepID=A0ABP6VWG1_9ACTN